VVLVLGRPDDGGPLGEAGQQFVQGPNTVFVCNRRPRLDWLECAVLDSPQCRLMFTESEWYRQRILQHRGPANRSPVVLWPYPIFPQPARSDRLAAARRARLRQERPMARRRGSDPAAVCPRRADPLRPLPARGALGGGEALTVLLLPGRRRPRPLALAELLLCGCPTVGVATGAPFVESGRSGVALADPAPAAWLDAVDRCHALDRRAVAAWAAARFDPERIADTVIGALEVAREDAVESRPYSVGHRELAATDHLNP